MQRLSSNITLIFRIFVPIFWIVFFGILVVVTFFSDQRAEFPLNNLYFRIGLISIYLGGILIMYLTCWKWKRVDIDAQYLYITDYFKASRYPFVDILRLERKTGFLSISSTIVLKAPGIFGDKIRFVESGVMLDQLWKSHPELSQHLNQK